MSTIKYINYNYVQRLEMSNKCKLLTKLHNSFEIKHQHFFGTIGYISFEDAVKRMLFELSLEIYSSQKKNFCSYTVGNPLASTSL